MWRAELRTKEVKLREKRPLSSEVDWTVDTSILIFLHFSFPDSEEGPKIIGSSHMTR